MSTSNITIYSGKETIAQVQNSYNSLQYNNSILCNSSCQNIADNIYLVIQNSNTGDIVFDQQCTSSVECVLLNDIEFINNLQANNLIYQNIEQSTGKYLYVNENVYTVKNDITLNMNAYVENYSYQSMYVATNVDISTQCSSSSLNVQTDLFITIKNSTTGDINFSQQGNVQLSCKSLNSSKISSFTSVPNQSTVKAESKSSFNVAGLIGIIILVVLLIVIIIVIVNQNKRDKTVESKEKPKPKIIIESNVETA